MLFMQFTRSANRSLAQLLLCGMLAGSLAPARAQAASVEAVRPFLHPLFTDNMVVQRGASVPVWGWAQPGEKVTVTLGARKATTTADAQGKWMVKLGSFKPGAPLTLTVKGATTGTATHTNVLAGDVWICSGQSNMEMGIGGVNQAEQEIANANYPQVRLFTVPKVIATRPRELVDGRWEACTPRTVSSGGWGGFSAVGYFFGRALHEDLKVPIGLIHTSWGGTIAEAWTSAEALQSMEDFRPALKQVQELAKMHDVAQLDIEKLVAEWFDKNDAGSAGGAAYAAPALDDAAWKTMELPQHW